MKTCQYCEIDISNYCGGDMSECANCYEVRKRFLDFIQSGKNRNFVYGELAKIINRCSVCGDSCGPDAECCSPQNRLFKLREECFGNGICFEVKLMNPLNNLRKLEVLKSDRFIKKDGHWRLTTSCYFGPLPDLKDCHMELAEGN